MLGVFERAGFELTRRARERRRRGRSSRSRSTEQFELQRRRARPHRRRGLAAAVLRAGERRRRRRVAAARHDRRRALPERPRGRLRGRRVPGQPRRRAGRRRARLRVGRGDPRPGRPGGDLPCRASTCSPRPRTRCGTECARSSSSPRASPRSAREGAERQEQLLALVRAHGARLIGPNCLGIAVAGPRLNATFAARSAPSGNIGFSSQSRRARAGAARGGRARVGSGSRRSSRSATRPTSPSNDLLEWWEDDEATEVVLLYVESFGNPRRFGRLARRVARRKPILALKSGTSRDRPARRELAHGRAGGLRGRRRRALPPGRRHAGRLARGADRRRDAALVAARAEGETRRRAHERRRARHPLRRRLRRRGARACRRSPRRRPRACASCCRPRRASRTPSTCSARRPPRPTSRRCRVLLADPQVDAALVLFVPAVSGDRRRGRGRRRRGGARGDRRRSRCSPS